MILAPQPKVVPHAAQAGRNYVDGLNILDNDQYVVKERRMMAFDGVISISIAVEGDTGRLASRPIVATRGLIDEHLQADLLRRTEEAVLKMLETTYPNGVVHDAKQAEEIMRTAARRVFSRERGKKPITIANIVEV
jgi:ribonuclease J